ncbi:hypothetical protein L1O48_00610 [Ligilactobacillus equi]|uniref:hypothetical protein n=1 Tax=Ligilactobacillus equi TaxID=137357 RepID=UPI00046A5A53|nr:hypothetical protein [Ligilactobacillus equi]
MTLEEAMGMDINDLDEKVRSYMTVPKKWNESEYRNIPEGNIYKLAWEKRVRNRPTSKALIEDYKVGESPKAVARRVKIPVNLVCLYLQKMEVLKATDRSVEFNCWALSKNYHISTVVDKTGITPKCVKEYVRKVEHELAPYKGMTIRELSNYLDERGKKA